MVSCGTGKPQQERSATTLLPGSLDWSAYRATAEGLRLVYLAVRWESAKLPGHVVQCGINAPLLEPAFDVQPCALAISAAQETNVIKGRDSLDAGAQQMLRAVSQ